MSLLVFLNANVLFSAAYRPDSRLAELWALPHVRLVTSAQALAEARRNLDEPNARARLEQLSNRLVIAPPPLRSTLPPGVTLADPSDHTIPLVAIECRATHLLTGDGHFASLFGRTVEGVRVDRPGPFLREQSGRDDPP